MAKTQPAVLNDPWLPLETLRRAGIWDNRKLRLFAVACCRRVWDLLPEQDCRDAVLLAEQLADERAKKPNAQLQELLQTVPEKAAAVAARLKKAKGVAAAAAAAEAARRTIYLDPFLAAKAAATARAVSTGDEPAVEVRHQVALLVDIHGNPLWPVTLDPRLRTEAVVGIAQAAYDNRLLPSGEIENARLGVLADALEEAGCADWDILTHLRGHAGGQPAAGRPSAVGSPHVRGCWALDLVLGKV